MLKPSDPSTPVSGGSPSAPTTPPMTVVPKKGSKKFVAVAIVAAIVICIALVTYFG